MTAAEIALRAIGAFYIFAGIVGMRAMVMDHLMDQVLAGISLQPIPAKDHYRRWLLVSSVLAIGMGGMALLVLSLWAVPLFLFGAATQAFYLVWARTAFPPEDESERTGRRQTTNAGILYGAATLLVCLAAGLGQLRHWLDPWALTIPLAGLALLSLIGRHFLWNTRRNGGQSWDDAEPEPREVPPAPPRVRLAPAWGGYPLRNADAGDGVIYDDYLPKELADRLYEWSRAFHGGDDEETQEFWAEFEDAADEAAHRAEGDSIVAGLRTIFDEAEGPVYPADIRHVGPAETL
jgi:MFS family permease